MLSKKKKENISHHCKICLIKSGMGIEVDLSLRKLFFLKSKSQALLQ